MSGVAIGAAAVGLTSIGIGLYQSSKAKKEAKQEVKKQAYDNEQQMRIAKAESVIQENAIAKQNALREVQDQIAATERKNKSKRGLITTGLIGGSLLIGTVLSLFIIKKK